MKTLIISILLLLSTSNIVAQPQLESKSFFEAFKYTVALVESSRVGSHPDSINLIPVGTAFWVEDTASNSYVLVSNKHIFGELREVILSQYSSTGQTSALMIVTLRDQMGNKLWVEHPDSLTDIAAIKVKYFSRIGPTRAEIIGIPRDLFSVADEVVEGDEVFILGFPMGIKTTNKSFPILRAGVLSLKPTEDFLVLPNGNVIGHQIYLIDANVLGGNSGSPVFLKPVMNRPFLRPNALGGTVPKLIGIVSAYIIDLLPVVLAQAGVYAKGNSGITIVHRAEEILKVVDMALR